MIRDDYGGNGATPQPALPVPLEGALAAVARRLASITVQVLGQGARAGSGVVWKAGLVVTAAHVVSGPADVLVRGGRRLPARLLAQDPEIDLAALAIDTDAELVAADIGDSDGVRVGELVVAVGNPLGLDGALTAGMVHAVPRGVRRFVQADLRLAPGNSGGPLADARGQVIGVNTMIAGGLALAVPSRLVERFLARCGTPNGR